MAQFYRCSHPQAPVEQRAMKGSKVKLVQELPLRHTYESDIASIFH